MRRCSGAPRTATNPARTSTRSSAVQVRPTRMARASRVCSSTMWPASTCVISSFIELEVDRPDLVRSLRLQPLGLLSGDPAAFAGPDRAAQALLAPQPPDALVVHTGPRLTGLAAQHPPRHPPAPA